MSDISRQTCLNCPNQHTASESERRDRSRTLSHFLVLLVMAALSLPVLAQDSVQSLADRSTIVIRGRVEKIHASAEPMVAPSPSTAIISVVEMYAGKDIAGDQRGRTFTVILSRPDSVKVGEEAIFFGDPRLAGRTLTIADEGESPVTGLGAAMTNQLQSTAQLQKDKPVLARLAAASLVFRGTVEAVHPVETRAGPGEHGAAPASEHDPEWQVASIRIATPIRGGEQGQVVSVLFSASDDVVWFHAPKLERGKDAIFLAHSLTKEEAQQYRRYRFAPLLEKGPAYVVKEPSDVLPPADENRVRALIASQKEKQ